jgi:stearoyl-CoA desaturase (delta-9 desaturase)
MPPKSGVEDGAPSAFVDKEVDLLSIDHEHDQQSKMEEKQKPYERRIVWRNVIIYSVLHLGAAYGFYTAVFKASWSTLIWSYFLYILGGLGITAGAHRLWSHRSYKANAPLRFILMIFNCIAMENHVIEWARDHRVHHKYSETDADPHNATRGLFFSHVGWLLVKKHPDVIKKGKVIDMGDLYKEKILTFQRKFYWPMALFLCFVMPTLVPVYFWNENPWVAYFTAGVFRYTWLLHCTWAINSFAHMFGNRPYDKSINPRQNLAAAFWSLGEGWHNYHHVFPFDYRASEFPYMVNITTAFIDFFAWIGWATDRKSMSKEMVDRKKLRSGDGTEVREVNAVVTSE